jgi:hypothetical protein
MYSLTLLLALNVGTAQPATLFGGACAGCMPRRSSMSRRSGMPRGCRACHGACHGGLLSRLHARLACLVPAMAQRLVMARPLATVLRLATVPATVAC